MSGDVGAYGTSDWSDAFYKNGRDASIFVNLGAESSQHPGRDGPPLALLHVYFAVCCDAYEAEYNLHYT